MNAKSEDIAELQRKIAEQKKRICELERRVATDALTGLWNRAHFDQIVSIEIARSERLKVPLSLILIDIDLFKAVNDAYGHKIGDKVLRQLSIILSKTSRSTDMLFRWGGEEFVLLAPGMGYRASSLLAERLRKNVENYPFYETGGITVSLGVAARSGGKCAGLVQSGRQAPLRRQEQGAE